MNLDLLSEGGKVIQGSDLMLRIKRVANPGYAEPFDWEFEVLGENGTELIESTDEFMIRAPDSGFKHALSKKYLKTRGSSPELVKFYVKNNVKGFYAAVTLEIKAYYNHTTMDDSSSVSIKAVVNPNNSVNLEYNSMMDIRKANQK